MSNERVSGISRIPQDMRDAIERFERESTDILAEFLGAMESKKPPSIIYHYTNDFGLRGILDTGQLWFTDITSLNDPSELRHGFLVASEVLTNKAASGPEAIKAFADHFAGLHQKGIIQKSMDYFLCSFSSQGNDLGQWRSYADNGRGYALGFDAQVLEGMFTKIGETPIPNNSTFSLTYDDKKLAEIHSQIIDKLLQLISLRRGRNLEKDAIQEYLTELSLAFFVQALRAALFFKHEAYGNEKEFRFLQMHKAGLSPDVKQRARAYSLIKYREFDWKTGAPGALKKIIVGPAATWDKASQFAKECLRLANLNGVEIVHSEIPYRAI